MEWNEEDAVRVLQDSIELAGLITEQARSQLLGNDREGVGEAAEALISIVSDLTPGGSRKDGTTITRGQARELIAACRKLSARDDAAALVKVASDLMTQTEALMKMLIRVKADFKPAPIGEDWEDYLSTEQMVTVMGWVEDAKRRNPAGA